MLRIAKRSEKYQYVISPKETWLIKMLGALGLVSVVMLAWGYIRFMNMTSLLYAVFSLPLGVVMLYYALNAWLQLMYRGFDLEKHQAYVRSFWRSRTEPAVAVFIPAAGEAIEIVRKTARAARAITYKNKQVYILDDTKDQKYKALSEKLGCNYVNRPNSGEEKKAGNLNYALETVAPSDYVLVLDADFVPRKEILREMVPYAGDDVGIVQSPQHFKLTPNVYRRSKIEFGAGFIQREFYRLTQPARNRFGSAICVGTNALYNRTGLKEVGGFEGVGRPRQWNHSEDVHTGLKLLNFVRKNGEPYRIKYLPIQLATGICPSDYYSFYKQQNRWCTGSIQLMFSGKTMFSRVLRPTQKLCYTVNFLYYLYTMALLTTPLQLLVINLSHHAGQWNYALFFLPQFLLLFVITPFVLRKEPEPLASMIVVTANAYTFVQALVLVLFRKPLGWEATGSRTSGTSVRFRDLKLFASFYFMLFYVGTLGVVILNGGFGLTPSLFLQVLFGYSFIAQVVHMCYLQFHDYKLKRYVGAGAMAGLSLATIGVVSFAYLNHPNYNLHVTRTLAVHVEHVRATLHIARRVSSALSKKTYRPATPVTTMIDRTTHVAPGQTMSGLVADALRADTKGKTIPEAALGYTHDYLLQKYGYRELRTGETFTISANDVRAALTTADHAAQPKIFWANYAQSVGL